MSSGFFFLNYVKYIFIKYVDLKGSISFDSGSISDDFVDIFMHFSWQEYMWFPFTYLPTYLSLPPSHKE